MSTQPHVDEDVDDLDDVLDQFEPSAKQPATTASATASATAPAKQPATASTSTQPDADESVEEFTERLMKQMELFFKENDAEGWAGTKAGTSQQQKGLAAAWEEMLVEGMNDSSDPSPSTPKASDFQSHIRSTMDKLRESESDLKSSDPSASVDESLDAILKSLGEGNSENTEELQGMLEVMMGQLMSKEVLYEPLKELHDKFPVYLKEHASTLSADDKARYEAHMVCIKQLIDAFEEKTYRDDDTASRKKIVDLMEELQNYGQPPQEIMGPLPPGVSMGSDGLPDVPGDCKVN